jgi:CubicO group peptidase (beta-lactamase class C family)
MEGILPGDEWERVEPRQAGFDADALDDARRWLDAEAGEAPYRVAVVRDGRIVAEWLKGVGAAQQRPMASATKSLYSCMLGIAIAEGKVASADDRVVDYYPEMMDVPEGRGPKPGRFAKPEDRDITFRQLICNTSGYMKPGERPGRQFHYQTFGMNVLAHALAAQYGLYESEEPERLGGMGELMGEKLRDPIGASWGWHWGNFDHPPEALTGIFGYYADVDATALDMARIGLMWLRGGRWKGRQVVPQDWLREAVRVAPDIRRHCPEEEWLYGHGFWTNECGRAWPSLPRDAYAARGAGHMYIHVLPGLDLVVVQAPGIYREADIGEQDNVVCRITATCR